MLCNRSFSRRLAACFCLIALLVPLLTACGRPPVSPAAVSVPAASETLSVGFDSDFPPFSFVDSEGRKTGFDYELAEAICRRCGWTFDPVFLNWDEKDTLLEDGSIDCIWSCFSITSREDDYAWSVPYLNNQFVVVTRSELAVRSLSDLKGKRVYVQSSTSLASVLTGEYTDLSSTFAELCMVDDNQTAMLYLTAGEADACVLDLAAAGYFLTEYPGQLRILDDVLSDDQCGVAFRIGDEVRAEAVSDALLDMMRDGSL